MKHPVIAGLLLFLFFCTLLLSGCTNTPSDENETKNPTDEKFYDSRLIGQWENPNTRTILDFATDGTYYITEAEMETWYTLPGGILNMYGTNYTYALSENDTVLRITEPGFTRIWYRV